MTAVSCLVGLNLEPHPLSEVTWSWVRKQLFQQAPSHVIGVIAICNINRLPFYWISYSIKVCPCAFKTKAWGCKFTLWLILDLLTIIYFVCSSHFKRCFKYSIHPLVVFGRMIYSYNYCAFFILKGRILYVDEFFVTARVFLFSQVLCLLLIFFSYSES